MGYDWPRSGRRAKPDPHKWGVYEDRHKVRSGLFFSQSLMVAVLVSRHKTKVAADVACKRGQYVRRL